MSEEKITKRRDLTNFTPAFNASLLKDMGNEALSKSFDLLEKMIDAGKSDLFQGYASSIMSADLMHSAGLLSNAAYEAIFVMESVMGVVAGASSVIGTIFGAQSPFAPSLKTLIELQSENPKLNVTELQGASRTGGERQGAEIIEE